MLIAGLCGGGWLLWGRDGGDGGGGGKADNGGRDRPAAAGAASGGVRETVETPPANSPVAMETVYERGRLYFGAPEMFGPDDFGGNLHKIPTAIAFGGR